MSKKKAGAIESPMSSPFGTTIPKSESEGASIDRNPCPAFSKPHEYGSEGVPEVFTTKLAGKNYDNKKVGGGKMSSPMKRG